MEFITNKSEGAYLNSKKGQDQVSSTIAKSVLNYKKHIDQNILMDFGEIKHGG